MIARRRNNRGFTIVELVIVIVVLGVLATLVITTYKGIQSRERDSTRQKDIVALQTQLEYFFSQNGYYPSLGNMNSAKWLSKNMPKLDQNDLTDPSNKSNSIKLVDSLRPFKQYGYVVTDASGNSCESNDTNCAKYTLTATYEGSINGATTYQKASLD
jgi:prepilin-type N-terminal cleavage/methylation domain-containing protein